MLSSSASRLVAALLLLLLNGPTQAYPVLLQVEEGSTRCFQFLIPEGDDAHLAAVVVPSEEDMGSDDRVEAWYFDQIFKLVKEKQTKPILPKKFIDDTPDYVASHMSDFLKNRKGHVSPIQVSITNPPNELSTQLQYNTKFFVPLVVNFMGRAISARAKRKNRPREEDDNGYGICINNRDEETVLQFILDLVLVSEDVTEGFDTDAGSQAGFSKERHLTPLEESLQESISAANAILREMKYMEQREQRMRQTADNINSRVHWFSYLSVSILLSVTYLQVTYLKRYFHKKKLM